MFALDIAFYRTRPYVFTCLSLLLILSSTAFAAPTCNPFTVAGSYVRQNVGALPGNGIARSPYIDQLTLSIDGTAHWFNSASFDIILQGAFIPEVGSWTCLADGTVLVTTIGTLYSQNSASGDVPQTGQPLDINIFVNHRLTQKLTVVDRDTLQSTAQTGTRIALSDDPLGPGIVRNSCSPSGNLVIRLHIREFDPNLQIYNEWPLDGVTVSTEPPFGAAFG